MFIFFYTCFHFYSHLDQYYRNFYKGMIDSTTKKPDKLKKSINIFCALFVGCCFYFFYKIVLIFFIQNINQILVVAISLFFWNSCGPSPVITN